MGKGVEEMKALILSIAIVLLLWTVGYAAITFTDGKWIETFDTGCNAYQYPGSINCNGLSAGGPEGVTPPTGVTTISTDANYSGGGGGKGIRYWHRWGSNEISANIIAYFPTDQKEIWVRWYQRYQAGYAPDFVANPTGWYNKQLYIQQTDAANTPNIAVIPEWRGPGAFAAVTQGKTISNSHYLNYYQIKSGDESSGTGGTGWQTIMGGDVSDGNWHCFEVHLKMDTNATDGWQTSIPLIPPDGRYTITPTLDGIGQVWIDGVLIADNQHVNFSAGETFMQSKGWNKILLGSNHSTLANNTEQYVDYDDFAIHTTTPPGRDAQNNPYIGPIGAAVTPKFSRSTAGGRYSIR